MGRTVLHVLYQHEPLTANARSCPSPAPRTLPGWDSCKSSMKTSKAIFSTSDEVSISSSTAHLHSWGSSGSFFANISIVCLNFFPQLYQLTEGSLQLCICLAKLKLFEGNINNWFRYFFLIVLLLTGNYAQDPANVDHQITKKTHCTDNLQLFLSHCSSQKVLFWGILPFCSSLTNARARSCLFMLLILQ